CYERAAPNPILECLRITFAAHDANCKLPQRSHVCVKEKARHTTNRSPKHVGAKAYSRQPIKVIQQAGGKQRMQLAQENDLPALAFHDRTKRPQRRVSCSLS